MAENEETRAPWYRTPVLILPVIGGVLVALIGGGFEIWTKFIEKPETVTLQQESGPPIGITLQPVPPPKSPPKYSLTMGTRYILGSWDNSQVIVFGNRFDGESVLNTAVWGQADKKNYLTKTTPVSSDGSFSFPIYVRAYKLPYQLYTVSVGEQSSSTPLATLQFVVYYQSNDPLGPGMVPR